MTESQQKYTVECVSSILKVEKEKWNILTEVNVPFFDYEFLYALEKGKCLNSESGWQPLYFLLKNSNEKLEGILPTFIKRHSYGEFIFDFAWANAYHQNGIAYYPKIVSAFPFTPVSGKRFLLDPQINFKKVKNLFLNQVQKQLKKIQGSSIHFLFCRDFEMTEFNSNHFLSRHSYHFNWFNQGYKDFTDYLSYFKRKNRSQVQKERREIQSLDLKIERLTGSEICEHHIEVFYKFYFDHHFKRYGSMPYLTKEFFHIACKEMPDRILLILAKKQNDYVAGTFNFLKGKNLYGRYWGFNQDIKYLHFELCYYQLIEFAIQNHFDFFDAGYQGEHKIKRGLVPRHAYSSHFIEHPSFREAIARYIDYEKKQVELDIQYCKQRSPYKFDSMYDDS